MGFKERLRRVELGARVEYAKQLVFGPDNPETIPYLEASIRRFPKAADLRMLMSIACEVSRREEVAPEAKMAAELAPTDLPLQVRAGWTLVHNGEVRAARECVVRLREQAGDDYSPITDLIRLEALVTACEGDFATAEEKLRWTMATEPENTNNAHTLARFLALRDRKEEAVSVIDEAMWSAGGRFSGPLGSARRDHRRDSHRGLVG